MYRRLLEMTLEHLQILEQQIGQLDQELATLLHPHQDAVQRLAEVPGLAVDSAPHHCRSRPYRSDVSLREMPLFVVRCCPGDEESAGVNYSHRSPKGNRQTRRLLNQAANAAIKVKGSIFEVIYRRCVPRLGHNQADRSRHGAHRQCRLHLADPALGRSPLRDEARQVTTLSKYKRHVENDSATTTAGISDRITETSTQSSAGAMIFDPGKQRTRPCGIEPNHVYGFAIIRPSLRVEENAVGFRLSLALSAVSSFVRV